MFYSLIIPVYNRPDEVDELLESLSHSDFKESFEIVIVEDGSSLKCEDVVHKYEGKLSISYYYKENSGPGDSRNYGMKKAKGDYFIIFDSDCIIPAQYLTEVDKALKNNYVDCFGGPDKALDSFSDIQKAINFAMTSFLTTGGIRGGSEKIDKFQPRSFNMGLSRKAFEASNGFGNIHPGEDPDLSIRLWNLGFETKLFSNAYVYHKRRIDWDKFSVQVNKFGKARPILNSWYPKYNKLTFFFPSVFISGLVVAVLLLIFNFDLLLQLYFIYFLVLFLVSSYQNKSIKIGGLSVIAVWKQFYGYGIGFMESFLKIFILKQSPQIAFPELFLKYDMTKIIGLTGGIGSGKTTIANRFRSLGIPVYIADDEARIIMQSAEVIAAIKETFGNTVFENNILNRTQLAEIVFSNPDKLKSLNAIVHPAVKNHFKEWLSKHNDFSLVVYEAAILFESGNYKDFDCIITVYAPVESRIQRVIQRDGVTREQVLKRINAQWTDEQRFSKSDFVIENIDSEIAKRKTEEILKILKIRQKDS